MGTGSPGSVSVLHLLSAEPDPRSIVRTTPGADHVCSQRVYRGSRAHGWEWQCTALTLWLDQGSAEPKQATAGLGHGWRGSGSGRLMELTQGTNRVAQPLGLTATVAQGLADAGAVVGGSTGAGCGYWWRTARAVGALLTAMEAGGVWME